MRRSCLDISKCVDSVRRCRSCSLPVVRGFFAGFAWATDLVEIWVLVDEKVRLLFPSDMVRHADSAKFRTYQMG